MRLRRYPSSAHLMRLHLEANSNQVGITHSSLLFGNTSVNSPKISLVSATMPDYLKLSLGEEVEFQPHLVGYGYYYEEAFIRFIGEAIERYALITSANFARSKFIVASYNDLKSEDNVLPWEYIDIFSEEDYSNFKRAGTKYDRLSKDDKISWLWCPSLFHPGERICVPVQFLFTGLNLQEPQFMTGFSKGTAAHRGAKRALQAAILEAVEADAFMLHWYANLKASEITVDDDIVQELCDLVTGTIDLSALSLDLSMPDTPGYVFNTVLSAPLGSRPTVVYGLGAGLEPKQTYYRTYLESLASHRLARYGGLLLPKDYIDGSEREFHTNLDTNVAYWAHETNSDEKREVIRSQKDGNLCLNALNDQSVVGEQVGHLLNQLSELSQYGVALDITPLELAGTGWNVIRVFFPELVQMSLPSFPYSRHPRMLHHGGVTNPHPHPLP